MKQEFVMRGQTASGQQEILHFSGYKKGYAYRLTQFVIYPSTNIGTSINEMCGTITAGKTAVAPTDPNFNDEGLIGTVFFDLHESTAYSGTPIFSIVNDTFLITQDLILMVQDKGGGNYPINWQCRFESVKMNLSQEAVTNYKQFTISDGS